MKLEYRLWGWLNLLTGVNVWIIYMPISIYLDKYNWNIIKIRFKGSILLKYET